MWKYGFFFLLKFIIFAYILLTALFFDGIFFVSTIGINERKMRTTFHGFASIIHFINNEWIV